MKPLFPSTPLKSKDPDLAWHIDPPKEFLGQSLLLAGKAVGLYTHRVGQRTWPCLYQWPRLGRECPHCERATRFTCWVPVVPFGKPNQRSVITGGENTWKSVECLEPRIAVEIHMVKVIRLTPVFFKHKLQIGLAIIDRVAESLHGNTGDITRWLLHYWQWSDLTKWFGEAYRESNRNRTMRERADSHGLDVFKESPKYTIA